MDYLRKITDEMSITCIVNLHQTDIAAKYSDRIIGLNQGKKVFDEETSKFTENIMNSIYSDNNEGL